MNETEITTPCPVCGKGEFQWGHLYGQGLTFQPDGTSGLSKAFRFGTKMRARLCSSCRNIQIFHEGE